MRKIDVLDILKGKACEAAEVINKEFDDDAFYYCDYPALFGSEISELFMNDPYLAIRWASTIDKLLTIIKYYKTENDRLERMLDSSNDKLERLYDTFN